EQFERLVDLGKHGSAHGTVSSVLFYRRVDRRAHFRPQSLWLEGRSTVSRFSCRGRRRLRLPAPRNCLSVEFSPRALRALHIGGARRARSKISNRRGSPAAAVAEGVADRGKESP